MKRPMMTWYREGDIVPTGFYIAPRKLDVRAVVRGQDGPHAPDGARLRGVEGARYLRLPLFVGVLLTPVIGGAFALSMPAVVLFALGREIVRRARQKRVVAGQEPAPAGVYLGLDRLAVRHVGAAGEAIDAPADTRYWRVPTLLLVLLSPLAGGLFVVAFPVFLVVALVGGLARALTRPVVALWREHVYLLEARWEPSAAYLAHARERAARGEEPSVLDDEALDAAALDPNLRRLADEVEARRREEG
ncbi:MAG: hypothetical protein H6704_15425 [Myxococcales bacterium]|nr:hypothetical protein [Myxococcales bacterium]MCB9537641.1 hypothetical protein [Myxococcales bacterium]